MPNLKKQKTRTNPRKEKVEKKPKKYRPRDHYSNEDIRNALEAIEKFGLSIRAAGKKYKIPEATLRHKHHCRRPIDKRMGPPGLLNDAEENQLVNYITGATKRAHPVTKQNAMQFVEYILEKRQEGNKGRQPETYKKPSDIWWGRFKQRHPEISIRTSSSLTNDRKNVSRSVIQEWFCDVKNYFTEIGAMDALLDPSRNFCIDESRFSLSPKEGKLSAIMGDKIVFEEISSYHKTNITVLGNVAADGRIPPPMIIYPRKRITLQLTEKFPREYEFDVGKSEKGYITKETFYEYLCNSFNEWLKINKITRPIIIWTDWHELINNVHVTKALNELNIIVYGLPPNATHILQPLDVAIFAPLKNIWHEIAASYVEDHGEMIGEMNFAKAFLPVYYKYCTPENIISAFKECGLVPFDPLKPNYYKLYSPTAQRENQAHVVHTATQTQLDDITKAELESRDVEIKEHDLCEDNIEQLESNLVMVEELESNVVNIDELESNLVKIDKLESTLVKIEELESNIAMVDELESSGENSRKSIGVGPEQLFIKEEIGTIPEGILDFKIKEEADDDFLGDGRTMFRETEPLHCLHLQLNRSKEDYQSNVSLTTTLGKSSENCCQKELLKAPEIIPVEMSPQAASQPFKIYVRTLNNNVDEETALRHKETQNRFLSAEEEAMLANWVVKLRKRDLAIKRSDVMNSAKSLFEKKGRGSRQPTDPYSLYTCPGYGWFSCFLKRNPSALVRNSVRNQKSKIWGLSDAEKETCSWSHGIKEELESLNALDILLDRSRIFTSEEFNILVEGSIGEVPLVMKWYNVLEDHDLPNEIVMSFRGTYCANGNTVSPMVTFPEYYIERCPIKCPNRWYSTRSKYGWMLVENFTAYITDVFIPYLNTTGTKRPIILFIDSKTTHLTYQITCLCEKEGIILCQTYCPLLVLQRLRYSWRKVVREYNKLHPKSCVTISNVCSVISRELKKISKGDIISGFYFLDYLTPIDSTKRLEKDANLIQEGKAAPNMVQEGKVATNMVQEGAVAINLIQEGEVATNLIQEGKLTPNTIQEGKVALNRVQEGEVASHLIQEGEAVANIIQEGAVATNMINIKDKINNNVLDEMAPTGIQKRKIATRFIQKNEIASNVTCKNESATNAMGSSAKNLYALKKLEEYLAESHALSRYQKHSLLEEKEIELYKFWLHLRQQVNETGDMEF